MNILIWKGNKSQEHRRIHRARPGFTEPTRTSARNDSRRLQARIARATDNTGFCFQGMLALACPFTAMVPDQALMLFQGKRHRNSPIFWTYARAFCVTCSQFPRAAPEARRPRLRRHIRDRRGQACYVGTQYRFCSSF